MYVFNMYVCTYSTSMYVLVTYACVYVHLIQWDCERFHNSDHVILRRI